MTLASYVWKRPVISGSSRATTRPCPTMLRIVLCAVYEKLPQQRNNPQHVPRSGDLRRTGRAARASPNPCAPFYWLCFTTVNVPSGPVYRIWNFPEETCLIPAGSLEFSIFIGSDSCPICAHFYCEMMFPIGMRCYNRLSTDSD